MANTITFFRIAVSIVLLFSPAFSPAFYALYIAAGLSDMLDGFAEVTSLNNIFYSDACDDDKELVLNAKYRLCR